MAPRVMSAVSTRWLEWGQHSSQPGSQVRDADNNPVFTGSVVVVRRGVAEGAVASVSSLIDTDAIECRVEGFSTPMKLDPRAVEVRVALPVEVYPRAVCNRVDGSEKVS